MYLKFFVYSIVRSQSSNIFKYLHNLTWAPVSRIPHKKPSIIDHFCVGDLYKYYVISYLSRSRVVKCLALLCIAHLMKFKQSVTKRRKIKLLLQDNVIMSWDLKCDLVKASKRSFNLIRYEVNVPIFCAAHDMISTHFGAFS